MIRSIKFKQDGHGYYKLLVNDCLPKDELRATGLGVRRMIERHRAEYAGRSERGWHLYRVPTCRSRYRRKHCQSP